MAPPLHFICWTTKEEPTNTHRNDLQKALALKRVEDAIIAPNPLHKQRSEILLDSLQPKDDDPFCKADDDGQFIEVWEKTKNYFTTDEAKKPATYGGRYNKKTDDAFHDTVAGKSTVSNVSQFDPDDDKDNGQKIKADDNGKKKKAVSSEEAKERFTERMKKRCSKCGYDKHDNMDKCCRDKFCKHCGTKGHLGGTCKVTYGGPVRHKEEEEKPEEKKSITASNYVGSVLSMYPSYRVAIADQAAQIPSRFEVQDKHIDLELLTALKAIKSDRKCTDEQAIHQLLVENSGLRVQLKNFNATRTKKISTKCRPITISCRQGKGQVFNINGIADSGSALNILSFKQAKMMNLTMSNTDIAMVTVSGDHVVAAGAAVIEFAYNDVIIPVNVIVSPVLNEDLLISAETLQKLLILPPDFPQCKINGDRIVKTDYDADHNHFKDAKTTAVLAQNSPGAKTASSSGDVLNISHNTPDSLLVGLYRAAEDPDTTDATVSVYADTTDVVVSERGKAIESQPQLRDERHFRQLDRAVRRSTTVGRGSDHVRDLLEEYERQRGFRPPRPVSTYAPSGLPSSPAAPLAIEDHSGR